jgi:hypothetical protein
MAENLPLEHATLDLSEPFLAAPVEPPQAAEEMAILNDDVMIDIAPDRPCGKIRVKLVYGGRSTPIPADDPWAD